MALAVEWLPEEWPVGIPNLKQLLVVAPLTTPILLLFTTESAPFAGCGQFSVRGRPSIPNPCPSFSDRPILHLQPPHPAELLLVVRNQRQPRRLRMRRNPQIIVPDHLPLALQFRPDRSISFRRRLRQPITGSTRASCRNNSSAASRCTSRGKRALKKDPALTAPATALSGGWPPPDPKDASGWHCFPRAPTFSEGGLSPRWVPLSAGGW